MLYPPGTLFEVRSRLIDPESGHLAIAMREVAEPEGPSIPGPVDSYERSARRSAAGSSAARSPSTIAFGRGRTATASSTAEAVRRAWSAEPYDSAAFAGALSRLPALVSRWNASVGVAEGLTLGEHTTMVLQQHARYFGRPELALAAAIGLHDAGKPDAVARGLPSAVHELTKPVFREGFLQLDLSSAEAERWWPLIDGDPIGMYLRNYVRVGAAAEHVVSAAARAGLDVETFFGHLTRYYQADASSYTVDAGLPTPSLDSLFEQASSGGFVLHPSGRRLLFGSGTEERYRALECAVFGRED